VPPTRWLTAHEQLVWRAYLVATQRLQAQLDRDLQQQAGLSLGAYQILAMLSEARDRTLRMSELAVLTLSSRSRLSHAVDRLEANAWVERRPCPDDRRGAVAVLTEAGLSVLRAAAPKHVHSVRRHLFDRLTPAQQAQLGVICSAVADGLAATEAPQPEG
jgi:DNA-binding MarR family transcriptional regulator